MLLLLVALFSLLAPEPSQAEDFSIRTKGSATFRSQLYPGALPGNVNHTLHFLDLEGGAHGGWGRNWQFQVSSHLHFDPKNRTERERFWAEIPEAYFQGRQRLGEAQTLLLQLGLNTFTWGVTDGFNPVDVVSARRYSDPLNSEKLGAPSLLARADFGAFLLEAIYIPSQSKSILPGENSRWIPREVKENQVINGQYFNLPHDLNFSFSNHEELSHALSNNYGLRLSTHIPDLDLSLYGFDGAAPVPAAHLLLTGSFFQVLPDIIVNADPRVNIRPVFFRQRMAGASVVYSAGEVLVRTEAAILRPSAKRADLPGDAEEYIAELEHTFSWERSSLTLILEGTYGRHSDQPSDSLPPSLERMFDRGIVLGTRYKPYEALSISAFALRDTKYHSALYRLELEDALSDSWKFLLNGEIFAGKISSPLGVYRKNDRITAGLRLSL